MTFEKYSKLAASAEWDVALAASCLGLGLQLCSLDCDLEGSTAGEQVKDLKQLQPLHYSVLIKAFFSG